MDNCNWCNPENNGLPNGSLEKEIVDILFDNTISEDWIKLMGLRKVGDRTNAIKKALAGLGVRKGYRIYTNRIKDEAKGIKQKLGLYNNYYPNKEWLLDLIWSEENEESGYETQKTVVRGRM